MENFEDADLLGIMIRNNSIQAVERMMAINSLLGDTVLEMPSEKQRELIDAFNIGMTTAKEHLEWEHEQKYNPMRVAQLIHTSGII